MSDLLSSRFVNLAVTIPLSTTAVGAGDAPDNSGDGDSTDPLKGGGDNSSSSGWSGAGTGAGPGGVVGGRSRNDGGGVRERQREGQQLERDLQLIVRGLLRLGEMEKVLGVVQERVSEDLKLIIR